MKTYYTEITGVPSFSTVNCPSRSQDWTRVTAQHPQLKSEFGDPNTQFQTKKGTVIATGFLRMVYGDHGPYIEFHKDNLSPHRDAWKMTRKKGQHAWYDECMPKDGSNCKLYVQKRDVSMLPNPPAGKYSVRNNRTEGYADYRIGRFYISPDDIAIK